MADEKTFCDDEVVLRFQSLELSLFPADVAANPSNITELFLDYNDIEDLPDELTTNCRCLKTFSIVGNSLKYLPSNFGLLVNLENLYLNENDLEVLPDTIQFCVELRELNLVGNQLKCLPKEIGNLKKLTSLFVDENKLESIPATFGLLCNLEIAEFSCNKIKELPRNIGHLQNLRVFNLACNSLDMLPDSFAQFQSLEQLELSNNKLKFLPDTFNSRKCLKKLYIDENVIETFPTWINHLPQIEVLSVKDNRLQEKAFSDDFGKLSCKLIHLNLAGNYITDIPDSIGKLTALETIHLGSPLDELERRNFQNGNWLWRIPDTFVDLILLRKVNLDENQLSELPKDFGKLIHLEELNLGQNRLIELPISFGCLKSLRVCLLSINNLELLPPNLGDLENLEDLRIDNNKISELPESFIQLTKLKTLDLFNNNLEEIPECLKYFNNLIQLDISENPLPMHHLSVPQKGKVHKYTPRDPNLQNNWRGRPRKDIIDVEITTAEVPRDDYGEIPDEPEPPEEQIYYNFNALQNAMRKNMALWKSHKDSSSDKPRQKYSKSNGVISKEDRIRREKRLIEEHTPEISVDMFEDYDADIIVDPISNLQSSVGNIYCNGNNSERKAVSESGSSTTEYSTSDSRCSPSSCGEIKYAEYLEEEEEDWDKECEDHVLPDNPYGTSYTCDTMLGFKPVYSNNSYYNQHTFVPSTTHALNHLRSEVPLYEIVEGQFDDAEDDFT